MLALNASGSEPIEDTAGNRLDGEWANPTSTSDTGDSIYPSGNGVAGSDFDFRFNVLPGDANQDGSVNFADLNKVLTNYNLTGMSWSQGNVTGDGIVNFADLNKVLTNYNLSLPSGEPAAGSFPADILLVAASVPTAVSSASTIPVTPATTVGTPATSTSDSTDDVVAIASPEGVVSGQAAAPATSSVTETAVPAIASVSSSVATSQPAYLENESQPTAPLSLSAQVSPSQSTVTAAASPTTGSFPAEALSVAATVPTTVNSEVTVPSQAAVVANVAVAGNSGVEVPDVLATASGSVDTQAILASPGAGSTSIADLRWPASLLLLRPLQA